MTDGYDCYQNALAERINGILKTELLLSNPENLEQARKMVDEAVQIYNTERPHMALKNKTPDAPHRANHLSRLLQIFWIAQQQLCFEDSVDPFGQRVLIAVISVSHRALDPVPCMQ